MRRAESNLRLPKPEDQTLSVLCRRKVLHLVITQDQELPETILIVFGLMHELLRDKHGSAVFVVRDPITRRVQLLDPAELLNPWQARQLPPRPDFALQFARFLRERESSDRSAPVEVQARIRVSLNGREPAWLVDPEVDLAAQPRGPGPVPWILPLPR